MKTTIEIADDLLASAECTARRRGMTLGALVEHGLRQVLAEPGDGTRPFRLRSASFGGDGLRADGQTLGWDALREMSYRAGGR